MENRSSVVAVYGEFVRKPHFVIVHSHLREGHERFDQYQPFGLIELALSVVEHLTAGRRELLEQMCALDAKDKASNSHRSRRYISENQDDLYPPESTHLAGAFIDYKGFRFGTNADRVQTRSVIDLACRAAKVPYATVRKLPGFKSGT